jgi:hypothetical protein
MICCTNPDGGHMQNNDFHRTAMTAVEARSLVAEVAAVIAQRDGLLAEVNELRQVLDALESLRKLLDEVPLAPWLLRPETDISTPLFVALP